ncbi:MAG: YciI family protein [Ferruginibacter sp.]
MKEYLLLLRGGKPMASKTAEEGKAEMQAWGIYMDGLGKSGSLVMGLPLVGGGKTVFANSVTDEAITSAKEGIVGGYLIVKAESLDAAADIAKGCPHITNEGNIEVREIAPMPAM